MFRYVGKGTFLQGVPMRDLDAAEVAALDEATRALCLASGNYVEVVEAPTPTPSGRGRRVKGSTAGGGEEVSDDDAVD